MSNIFDFPCAANKSALIMVVCGCAPSTRASTAAPERWPAPGYFFEPAVFQTVSHYRTLVLMYMDSPMPYLTCSSCTPVLDLYHSCMTSHHNGMLAWLGRYFRASCVLPLQLCFPSLQICFRINVFLLTADISWRSELFVPCRTHLCV